ncbi:hypothetical protein SPRG_21665 [Saprolegnia parasitica CBS 223.65]|uniref:Enoyl reductase (ER) domain-containing protein n=1 Tax=Saprolegnia parasitica (strain CBS 223.65) TaxID=695850 RepID=A0A067BJS3_SAPPC|nr:hypothetical protein SPRG_21665 [Saprolegnia parasitica CBS 223.65]KDO18669.1 hypothetical protein SPRG_21665 [Saprolegnia parasitica CBS 223.65]|eukprot:XP_012210633.1 hypothetical protein SPRG_21665 [Saprolegnia parasitica CBS 223.65]
MRALMLVERVKSFTQPDLASCFEVQNVPVPVLGADQVLVKVACSPINPSNLMQLQGLYDNFGQMPLPQVTGGEGSGTVVAAGDSAYAQSLIGKRVGTVANPAGMWAEYVADIGAEYIVDTSNADWVAQLEKLATELGATIGFDAVGGATSGAVLSAMPANSELFVYGALSGEGVKGVSPRDLIFLNKKVSGFWLVTYLGQRGAGMVEMVGKVANALTSTFQTKIRVSYPLEEAAAAFQDYSANMSNDKVAFKPFN